MDALRAVSVMYTQSDLDRIRDGFPDILQHYDLSADRDFCATWRDDSHPSCHFSREWNMVTDFGDGMKHYNVFEFVGVMESLDTFPEQVQKAAEILGLQIGDGDSSTPTRPRPKAVRPRFEPPAKAGFDDMPLLPFAWMMGRCLESDDSKAYLHGRGFCNHDIYQNVLGYTPTKDVLLNDDGSQMFTIHEPNRPRGYIVIPFPVDETFCRIDYVMLRAIPGDMPPAQKEMRPTGCKSPLYREYLLASACDALYIAEGLLDTLALDVLLVDKPCMGLGGTSMAGRVGKVLYYTPPECRPKKIIVALDADDAGRDATAKICADLDYIGIPHSVFTMPDSCKDPCDVLMQVGGGR